MAKGGSFLKKERDTHEAGLNDRQHEKRKLLLGTGAKMLRSPTGASHLIFKAVAI
jgi:hypothetical protein